MSRARLALVVHSLDPGGIQRHVCRLANHINSRYFISYIVSLTDIGPARSWVDNSEVSLVAMEKRPGNDFGVILRLATWLRRQKIDIIHSHNWGTLVECTLARYLARTPLHFHSERGTVLGGLSEQSYRTKIRAIAAAWCLRSTNALVTNAESIAAKVARLCAINKGRVLIIPNGIPEPRVDPNVAARIRSGITSDPQCTIIGSAGRLEPVKSFSNAVRAMAILRNRGMNAVMVVIGDGPCRDHLLALARELAVQDRFILPGYQEDVLAWISIMDIYFNCSTSEAFSQAVVEAMSLGRPMVLTSVGDHANLGSGSRPCAVVVPPGDPEQLASAISAIITNKVLSNRFSENAIFQFRQTYSLETMVRRYEQLYTACLRAKIRGLENDRRCRLRKKWAV